MAHKKKIFIGLLAMAILSLIAGALLYRTDSLTIIPYSTSSTIALHTYHEEGPYFSKTACRRTSNGIEFSYTLNKQFGEPFAAVYMMDTSKSPLFDASPYDQVEIRLHSKKGKRIPITLSLSKQVIAGKDTLDAIPYTTVVDHYGNDTTYTLQLSKFQVPSWWLRYDKLSETNLEAPDFSKVRLIVIGSCQALGPEIQDTILISDLRFVPSNRTLLLVIGSIWLLLLLTTLYLRFVPKKITEQKSLQIAYTPLAISDEQHDEFGKIVTFISSNYSNAELSLTDVQNGVGMNSKAISKLIKENLHISFTDYLNQLRITEVKRLLKETKLPVSDIAYKVGYNNISHFNRVFKTITGTSPKVYREE